MLINFGINFKVGENYLVFNMHAHTVHELRSGSACMALSFIECSAKALPTSLSPGGILE